MTTPLLRGRGRVLVDSTGAELATATNPVVLGGNVAHDGVDAGNPIKVGGKARAAGTPPAAVAAGDRVDASYTLYGSQMVALGTSNSTGSLEGGNTALVVLGDNGSYHKLCVQPFVWTGSADVAMRGDSNGLVVQNGLSTTFWSYTNGTTGILSNTTAAVTIKTSAGASVRNYIDSIQIATTAFGASVPVAIRDGAGGTVLWSANVPTAGLLTPVSITFQVPLKGTAATLLEVVTPTANTSGTVWINVQGHTGS